MDGSVQNYNSLCRIATRTYNVKGIARKLIDQNNAAAVVRVIFREAHLH